MSAKPVISAVPTTCGQCDYYEDYPHKMCLKHWKAVNPTDKVCNPKIAIPRKPRSKAYIASILNNWVPPAKPVVKR